MSLSASFPVEDFDLELRQLLDPPHHPRGVTLLDSP